MGRPRGPSPSPPLAAILAWAWDALRLRRGATGRPPTASPPRPGPGAGADALGRRGERAAVRALRRAGYRVVARRFRARGGEEVDVVALDGDTLVVVEVKATASESLAPGARVDHRKRRRLRAAAASLLRASPGRPRPVRIDVVEVRFRGRLAHAEIRRGHTRLS